MVSLNQQIVGEGTKRLQGETCPLTKRFHVGHPVRLAKPGLRPEHLHQSLKNEPLVPVHPASHRRPANAIAKLLGREGLHPAPAARGALSATKLLLLTLHFAQGFEMRNRAIEVAVIRLHDDGNRSERGHRRDRLARRDPSGFHRGEFEGSSGDATLFIRLGSVLRLVSEAARPSAASGSGGGSCAERSVKYSGSRHCLSSAGTISRYTSQIELYGGGSCGFSTYGTGGGDVSHSRPGRVGRHMWVRT